DKTIEFRWLVHTAYSLKYGTSVGICGGLELSLLFAPYPQLLPNPCAARSSRARGANYFKYL
ncbi:MAG: hypothetical protein MUP41_10515, partial [Desulfobacterales bacterium]|nr:hypothetical protein [Desulfobacterales bacterium]